LVLANQGDMVEAGRHAEITSLKRCHQRPKPVQHSSFASAVAL
jgi:hypothetical protein